MNKYCSKCGKCMTNKDGTSVIGIHLQARVLPDTTDYDKTFWQEQLGKYEVKDYSFCYECWLDSLFQRKLTNEK